MSYRTAPTGAPMMRPPLLATSAAGVVVTIVAAFLQGSAGAIGAGLAAVVTIAFFGVSLLLLWATRRLSPAAVMSVALLTYGLKIMLLGLMLVLVFQARWLSGMAFALSVIVCACVWLAVQVRTVRRARLPVYDR